MLKFVSDENLDLIMSFQVPQPPSDSVSSLNFSPKANHLIATSWDNQVYSLKTALYCFCTCFIVSTIYYIDWIMQLDKLVLFCVI